MSILDKKVSFYPSTKETGKGTEISLLSLLLSNEHKEAILKLRTLQGPEQEAFKKELPCFTVAGTFNGRSNNGLIEASSLACIDLDSAESFNRMHLLNELRKIDCIAYAGLSCRGKRLYCIIPLKFPERYQEHYEALIKSFERAGLPMGDTCHSKISQPRYVSWNDSTTEWFNHDAKPYSLLQPKKQIKAVRSYQRTGASPGSPFDTAARILEKQGINFIESHHHEYIFNLCRVLNKLGVSQAEAEQFINNRLLPLSEIRSNCITYPFKHYSAEHGTIT